MAAPNGRSSGKPTIFILGLDQEEQWEGLFDAIYQDLIQSLTSRYLIQRARKLGPAQRYLSNSQNRPIAILVVDPGVIQGKNVTVFDQLKDYVQKGGIAVFMANFSSFVKPDEMNNLWKKSWGLDWQMAEYERTDVYLNRSTPSLSPRSLPTSYSQKAVFLKNVSLRDSLYVPSPESRTQSMVVDPKQTPVAFTKVGHGWLGYIGDVNNEEGSQNVVMEICRFATYIAGSD